MRGRSLSVTMGKADLHIHTTYSYDSSCTVSAVLEWAANSTDLNVLAITDHDAMGGVEEAMRRAPAYGLEIIPGCEITTREGHLLSYFLERPVPAGLSLHETVIRVGEQGGLCVAAHPTALFVHGMRAKAIRSVLDDPDARKVLIGIETWNTGLFYLKSNLGAQKLNAELGLAATGGSDSHVFWTVGYGYTEFQGKTAADVRTALETYQTTAKRLPDHRKPTYWPNHLYSRVLRSMGWVTWAGEPNGSVTLRRLADIQFP
jgi:predicted metal-dependent phosphoesterase TrpH